MISMPRSAPEVALRMIVPEKGGSRSHGATEAKMDQWFEILTRHARDRLPVREGETHEGYRALD
jgi:hypothetical protein